MEPTNIPLTVDGAPLFSSVSEFASPALWRGDRVNPQHIGALTLPFVFPFAAVVLYLLSEPVFDFIRRATALQRNNSMFKAFILLHNLALAVFSLWVCIYSWPLVWRYYSDHGFKGVHCDRAMWTGSDGLATWATIFYMSKFYEFIDTWILVLKNTDGKRAPSFLQKFHHFGVVLCMWAAVAGAGNWIFWCVCLNSFIHTLMYTYYALATLGYRSPWAKVLTNLQILQFFMGIIFSSCIYFYSDCESATPGVKAGLMMSQCYAAILICLFNDMRKKKYAMKKKDS